MALDFRSATAVIMPPLSDHSRDQSRHEGPMQHWDGDGSSQRQLMSAPTHMSVSRDEQRARKKRSANYIKARPANPAVLDSIIGSFEALTPPPPLFHPDEHYLETGSLGSKRSRPYSSDGSAAAPSIARSPMSPGFGMEYGGSVSPMMMDEEPESPDAAPPPSIRTSRPPSGMSRYTAQSPTRALGDVNGHLRPASVSSRTSSFTSLTEGRERDGGTRNKHSAESWIKRDTHSSISGSTLMSSNPQGRRKSLRRITSQETLRQPQAEEIPMPLDLADLQALSRAEQILARTPPPLATNKGRLYLSDSSTSEEKVVRDSLLSETKSSEVEESPMSSQKGSASEATISTEQSTPSLHRISPRQGSIVDSIPTRTSSLRATSSSPAPGKRKGKKSKRATVAVSNVESPAEERTKAIPESSWADLGDEDETVKRIKELRQQRRSRIEESRHHSMYAEIPQIPSPREAIPVPSPTVYPSEDANRASRIRPLANRATTEPPLKAHKILGIADDTPMPTLIGAKNAVHSRAGSELLEKKRRPQSRVEERAIAIFATNRSGSPSSPTPPLSLDYSYAQAVDALQGAEREITEQRPAAHARQPSKKSLVLNPPDLPPLAPLEYSPTATKQSRPKSARRRPDPAARWTHHPDLPLETLERRNSRRKSMSDARRTRPFEEDSSLERRDSIEDAVLEYLRAPRLSRKLQHPRTGRVISFSEVGDPNGAAVFICVGMGLTRYVTAFYDDLATTLQLRLITVDRPGVGGSEPYPSNDRTGPLSWPDDVLAICQHLGITNFSLLAHSAGAIYALATALILPHLINGKVHLLAPWIPPSQLEALSHPTASAPPAGALPRSQRILRVLPTSFLKAANSSFMTATSASLKPASKRQIQAARERSREQPTSPTRAPDRPFTSHRPEHHRRESLMLMDQFMPTTNPLENFPIPLREEEEDELSNLNANRRSSLFLGATAMPTDPALEFAQMGLSAAEHADRERKLEYTSRLTQRTWELATRDSNPATDLLVCLERNREIGFRYTDVNRQVVITHGSEDKRVPLANVKWLSDQINARAISSWSDEKGLQATPQSREGWADHLTSHGGCDVRVLEGEGHGLMASAPIMSDVLTEIAGYWNEKRGFAM